MTRLLVFAKPGCPSHWQAVSNATSPLDRCVTPLEGNRRRLWEMHEFERHSGVQAENRESAGGEKQMLQDESEQRCQAIAMERRVFHKSLSLRMYEGL